VELRRHRADWDGRGNGALPVTHLAVEQFGAAALNDELALVADDAGAPHHVELVVATGGHG
jgi:hypothetical protein